MRTKKVANSKKDYKTNMGHHRENKTPMILEIAQESLPGILSSKSLTVKVKEEVKRHHRWLGVVFYYSRQFPRSLRVLSLATNMIIMLFMQALTYNLTNNNDAVCLGFHTEQTCLERESPYRTGGSLCAWIPSTENSGDGQCLLIEPDSSMEIVIFVAIFSALVSTPIALLVDWLVSHVLCAPTQRTLKSQLLGVQKVVDSSGIAGMNGATSVVPTTAVATATSAAVSVRNDGTSRSMRRQGISLTDRSPAALRKRAREELVLEEYRSLARAVHEYYMQLSVVEDKKEFRG